MAYTAFELDEMRQLIGRWIANRNYRWTSRYSGGGLGASDEQIERELHTHMMNGTSVADLQEWVRQSDEAKDAKRPTEEQDRAMREHQDQLVKELSGKRWFK